MPLPLYGGEREVVIRVRQLPPPACEPIYPVLKRQNVIGGVFHDQEAVMATATLQLEGVVYSIHSHRGGNGHFATWECVTCGTAGGKSKVYADEHSASEATRLLIVNHQSRRH